MWKGQYFEISHYGITHCLQALTLKIRVVLTGRSGHEEKIRTAQLFVS